MPNTHKLTIYGYEGEVLRVFKGPLEKLHCLMVKIANGYDDLDLFGETWELTYNK